MKTWRRITHGFWATFLVSCFAVILSYAILEMTLLNPATTKRWLHESGAYDSLRTQLLDSATASSSSMAIAPLTSEDIRASLETAITEETVQREGEKVINITYAWLEGERNDIRFSVTLADKAPEFYAALEKRLVRALAELPACDPSAAYALLESNTITCLPPEVDATALAKQSMDSIRSDSSTFATPITEEAFSFPQEQQDLLAKLPTYLDYLKITVVTALVLSIASIAYLLIRRRSAGAIIIGTSLLLVSLEFIALRYLLKIAGDSFSASGDNEALSILKTFADVSSGDTSRAVLGLCIPLLVSGILLIIAGFIWRSLGREKKLRDELLSPTTGPTLPSSPPSP